MGSNSRQGVKQHACTAKVWLGCPPNHCQPPPQAGGVPPPQPSQQAPASHAPARELLKLSNPAENRLHCCADFLMGQQHQSGQRGSQEKREEAVLSPRLPPCWGQGGGKPDFSPLAEASLVLSLHFASCKWLYSYYKSTESISTQLL